MMKSLRSRPDYGIRRTVGACLAALVFAALWMIPSASAQAATKDILGSEAVIDGFNKTVFGAEYSGFGFQQLYVRKFNKEVLFYVDDKAAKARAATVRNFIISLNGSVRGLRTRLVSSPSKANFIVYVVDRKNYVKTVRDKVYKNPNARVIGRCMVRTVFSRGGIRRSDAVVVSDRGERLFRRCMVEEILQGLGPLNEDLELKYSVFNDASRQSSFTKFDRLIMNMLYDRRLKVGTSQKSAQKLLPLLYRDARRRIR